MTTTKKNFRAIRKSAFTTYKKCQKKFEYFYNDPDYWNYGNDSEEKKSDALIKGGEFHDGCESFFNKLEGRVFTPNLPSTFKGLTPKSGYDDVNKWFDWFVETEQHRYTELEEQNLVGSWFPVAMELEVKMKDNIDRTGHVYRVDVMPGIKELCIVEYKTGKSYDMDNKYSFTDMNAEIGFYVNILNKAKVFPGYKMTHWKVINPTLEKIWMNRISPISLKAVDVTYAEITGKLFNKGTFNRNVTKLCNWCPYVDDCLFKGEYEY